MSDNMNEMQDRYEGQISYANEVITTIVSVATTEVEGISGIAGSGNSLTGIIVGKGKGRAPKGVKVDVNGDSVSVDVSVTVDYGIPIQKVGRSCQENIRKSIETMTGLHVEKVDLHVVGVSFEKENQELQQGQKLALDIKEDEAAGAENEKSPAPDATPNVEPVWEEEEEENEEDDLPDSEEDDLDLTQE